MKHSNKQHIFTSIILGYLKKSRRYKRYHNIVRVSLAKFDISTMLVTFAVFYLFKSFIQIVGHCRYGTWSFENWMFSLSYGNFIMPAYNVQNWNDKFMIKNLSYPTLSPWFPHSFSKIQFLHTQILCLLRRTACCGFSIIISRIFQSRKTRFMQFLHISYSPLHSCSPFHSPF